MNADTKEKWVAALRSGQYQQAQGMLRLDDKFCCLGVLCDVAGADNAAAGGRWTPTGCYTYQGESEEAVLPDGLRFRLGLSPDDEIALFNMNDDGVSFEDIADFIEANL